MIESMVKAVRADKIRDGGRTMILLLCIYCAAQIQEVKQRVGIIEYRLGQKLSSTNVFNGFAQNQTGQKPERNLGH
jgi:hypothetical protein